MVKKSEEEEIKNPFLLTYEFYMGHNLIIQLLIKSNIITINTYLLFNVMILPGFIDGNNSFNL